MSLTDAVKQIALALGFDAVGVAVIEPAPTVPGSSSTVSRLSSRLQAWLTAGYQATMTWMGRTPERRADPRLVLPGCRSVIVVGLNYDTGACPDERNGVGRIARYAWGRDYHLTVGERLTTFVERLGALAPEDHHRWYVDTGPVMEKGWAQEAGLGWIGKHSNLVSPQHGSWLVLGVVLTTVELSPDTPGTDLCGTCSLCIKACPTGAITAPYVVDARRCISYLTIEHRADDIPKELADRMGNHIFGCDDCLDVCPYNTQAAPTRQPEFAPRSWVLRPALTDLLAWTESEFRSHTYESPVRRARYEGFQRNLRVARKNADHRSPAQ